MLRRLPLQRIPLLEHAAINAAEQAARIEERFALHHHDIRQRRRKLRKCAAQHRAIDRLALVGHVTPQAGDQTEAPQIIDRLEGRLAQTRCADRNQCQAQRSNDAHRLHDRGNAEHLR